MAPKHLEDAAALAIMRDGCGCTVKDEAGNDLRVFCDDPLVSADIRQVKCECKRSGAIAAGAVYAALTVNDI